MRKLSKSLGIVFAIAVAIALPDLAVFVILHMPMIALGRFEDFI